MGGDFEDDIGFETDVPAKKPKIGSFKDTASRLRQGKENHLAHRASLDWRLDHDLVCRRAGADADFPDIEKMKMLIRLSRTGEALLDESASVAVSYDMQTVQSQFYPQAGGGVITLNPHYPQGALLNTLVRELRRAWQHRHDALANPMGFEPEDAILVNRAQQADALMISIKVAWELKLVGESEAWDFMAGSPFGNVARIFEIHAQKDFRSLNNGAAARSAYDKFFEGCNTKSCDKRVIHQMLLDDRGYMKAGRKPQRAKMDLFYSLGKMPHGANYLAARSKKLPTDLCYSTVEDRSNANFLWFIKFERNFQEREMQMLQESVKASAEIVDFARWSTGHRNSPS